jgi:hypothetical protein
MPTLIALLLLYLFSPTSPGPIHGKARGGLDPWGQPEQAAPPVCSTGETRGGLDPWGLCTSGN